jgi:hypothetical protein
MPQKIKLRLPRPARVEREKTGVPPVFDLIFPLQRRNRAPIPVKRYISSISKTTGLYPGYHGSSSSEP